MSTDQETFVSHLIELRERLVRAMLAFTAAFIVLFFWPGAGTIYDFLAQPLMQALPEGAKMIATGVITPFMVPVKVTALVAFMLALPVILFQAWAFVAPGLYEHEKKLALPIVVASTVLFIAGVAFCYFFVFGKAFPAIQAMAPESVAVTPDIEAYLDFVLTMFLAFGLAFEVPIAVVILARMGVVSIAQLRAWRRYFWVAAAAVAGLATPPDAVSMFALLIPMGMLYEVGIVAAQVFIKHTQAPADAEDSPAT